MPTIQERYEIERKRVVKNIALLKELKAQMNEADIVEAKKAQIRLELQRSETAEDWNEYERLTTTLTEMDEINEVLVDEINEVLVINGITVHVPTTVVQEVNAGIDVETEGHVFTAGTDVTDAALYDDDDDMATSVDLTIPFDRGCTFASPKHLLNLVSDFAKARNFTVRREKHAIVCSNAGESNWTTVTDYEARANQTFRKLHKLQEEHVDDNLQDIMQCEEDKVSTVQAFIYVIFPFAP
jgi:hypothetical protein